MKISIIIPVYNEAEKLKRCITSLGNDKNQNREIILIDDGSEEKTREVCDQLAGEDSRIRVFHLPHGGVSKARNYAIDMAVGEYLQFVDANDWIKGNMTLQMQKAMREDVDLVVCGYWKFWNHIRIESPHFDWRMQYTAQEYINNITTDPGHHYYGVVWNKLYRRSIIMQNNLRFCEDVTLGEDFIFNLSYLTKCRKIRVLHKKLYYYDCRSENSLSRSSTRDIESCKRELSNRHVIYAAYCECFQNLGATPKVMKKIPYYWEMYLIRNKYYLKKHLLHMNDYEIEIWTGILENDPQIHECSARLGWFRVYRKMSRICVKQKIKSWMRE